MMRKINKLSVGLVLFLLCYLSLRPPILVGSSKRFKTNIPGTEQLSADKQQAAGLLSDFGQDGLKGLSPEQKQKIFSGEVVILSSPEWDDKGRTLISAALVFKVPIEQAWSILSLPELQAEYLEEIEEIKLLSQGPDFNRMLFVVKILGKKVRYTVVHHFSPQQFYLWWELDQNEPGDLKELYGFWKLFRYDDHQTVARYGSYVKPSFPLPAFLLNYLYQNDLKSSLAKVKIYIEREK